jgi:hypothetical protein
MLKRCSSLTWRALLDPLPAVQIRESGSEEDSRRGARGGVVVGETLGRFRVPVPGRDRVDEVAVATAKTHPPDRDHAPCLLHGGVRDERLY